MKCLKMRVAEIFLLMLNFLAIYSLNDGENKPNQTGSVMETPMVTINWDKRCPALSKFVRENNITDYVFNCKPLKNDDVNEENVLLNLCFVISSVAHFLCQKNVSENLSKFKGISDSFCPFNFSHWKKLQIVLPTHPLTKELEDAGHCSRICYDLYSKRTQCLVLSFFNSYLKNSFQSELVEKPPPIIQETDLQIKEKVEMNETKQVITKPKTETTDIKSTEITRNITKPIKEEKKVEKVISTIVNEKKEKQIPTEKPEDTPNENDFRGKNVDINEDDVPQEEDMEDKSSLDESYQGKSELSQVVNTQKVEIPQHKMDSTPKEKEIYSGEGFFQAEDSHFFFYFIMVSSVIVVGYLAFHNKNKILAYALEGSSGRRSRRRPNPARYRKLETNLEEVISSSATNATSSTVVY